MAPLVLALNPSIDAEWAVDTVLWEEKNTIRSERRWAGGKGINVARWLRHLGGKPRLLLPLGGPAGKELARHLRCEKLQARIVRLRETTRVNVIVTPVSGRQLRFNPPGPRLTSGEWRAVLTETTRLLNGASCLVLSGSLPRGVPPNAYAQLIRLARRAGVKTILDCDGAAFAKAVAARPFLVKPNEHELALWWGKPLRSESAVRRVAQKLSAVTGGWVLVSRGPRRGFQVNAAEGAEFSARPPRVKAANTVGAGDALLAAVVRQIESSAAPADWLRHGVAAGSAATNCAAGHLPNPSLLAELAHDVALVTHRSRAGISLASTLAGA